MQIYLVGGAVRDTLLGLPIKERDWVVVGSTPEEMMALGFQPVGKEFPVFLHPETHEEYALARTERKVAKGYKGFTFFTDPSVTLEQDLLRRDLTINAMALDEKNKLIDPYGGQSDLTHKLLRHVSSAFAEDPVRILRLARFKAKLPTFRLHPDTLALMQLMVKNGEVDALVPERVWAEFNRALHTESPQEFFTVLKQAHALEKLFPDINPATFAEIFTREETLTLGATQRFAIIVHPLNITALKLLCTRYRIPNEFSELARLLSASGTAAANLNTRSAQDILTLLTNTDATRRKTRFLSFLTAARCCYSIEQPVISLLTKAVNTIRNINTKEIQRLGVTGKEFANKLTVLRLQAIQKLIEDQR